jgi:hypothetical protein
MAVFSLFCQPFRKPVTGKKQAALTHLDDGMLQTIAITAAQHPGELLPIEEVRVFVGNQVDGYQVGGVNDILS